MQTASWIYKQGTTYLVDILTYAQQWDKASYAGIARHSAALNTRQHKGILAPENHPSRVTGDILYTGFHSPMGIDFCLCTPIVCKECECPPLNW